MHVATNPTLTTSIVTSNAVEATLVKIGCVNESVFVTNVPITGIERSAMQNKNQN